LDVAPGATPNFAFLILHFTFPAMLVNYFRIALRHLQKNKLYALVNLSGLAIGIASCLLIGIYIAHEWSYDRFHKNADRIGRVVWHYNFNDALTKTSSTGTKVGPELMRRFPEVKSYVRLLKYPRVIKNGNELFEETNFLYADSAFFHMFSFPLVKGDPARVLDAPDKLVLSESTVKKYFGNTDPIGKTVTVGGTKEFVITGVVKDAPANSQIQYDLIGSFTSLNAAKTEKWTEANYLTYIMTSRREQLPGLQAKVDAFMQKTSKEELQLQGNSFSKYIIEPLTKVHLYAELDGFEPNNNIIYIYILAVIAFLILVIACVNYTNLNIAQSAGRIGEISMRKVMGAGRSQVFTQFITESLCLILIAFGIAMILSWLLLPAFNELAGKQFTGNILLDPFVLICLLIGSVLVTLTAGAYPALLLSNTRMMTLLKSGFRFTGSGRLRKGLIVVQFVIATFLIITTAIILQQLNFSKLFHP
jgi:putative ABC transport system permease protein